MLTRFAYGPITWIDLESPTHEEVEEVVREFELGPMMSDELLTQTAKPRVDIFPDFVYMVLHFPALRYTHGAETDHEIDMLVSEKFIITAHYTTTSATYDLKKAFEAAALKGDETGGDLNTGHVFLELAQRLYQAADNELDALEDAIEEIEENIFRGNERSMVSAISFASRELLNHKRLLGTHHEMLEAFNTATKTLFRDRFVRFVRGAETLHYRVHHRAVMMSDILNELRETNMALLSTRQNEIMKNLTIIAFVTFPLTLIAGIFGMNTLQTPIIGNPYDFYIILGGMATLTISFFIYFKIKKWF